jgi:REP element-mobilizing transposase RayT
LLPEQKELLAAYSHTRMEEYFDLGAGSCPFLEMRIADAMAAALRFREGTHYRLLAWCVMPNHVHVMARLFPGRELAMVVKAWKNFSARTANRALGRKGRFWQREYYDRLIRNEDEFGRAIRYILENTAKAGWKNWTWVWSAGVPPPHGRRPVRGGPGPGGRRYKFINSDEREAAHQVKGPARFHGRPSWHRCFCG